MTARFILDLEAADGPLLLDFKPEEITVLYIRAEIENAAVARFEEFEVRKHFLSVGDAIAFARGEIRDGRVFLDTVELCVSKRLQAINQGRCFSREEFCDIGPLAFVEWSTSFQRSISQGKPKIRYAA